jgi:hypothetical protein
MEVDADAGETVTDSLKLAFDDPVSIMKFVFVQRFKILPFRVVCVQNHLQNGSSDKVFLLTIFKMW